MHRPLRILVAALLCLVFAPVPVVADDSDGLGTNGQGGGGITILPFAAGENVCIDLPEEFRGGRVRIRIDGAWTNIAIVDRGKLYMDGAQLQDIFHAGVTEFEVFVIADTGSVLRMLVRYDEAGNVTVIVYT